MAAVVQLRHSQEVKAQRRMLRVHIVLAHRRQRRGIDGHHLGRRGPVDVGVLVLVPVDGVDGRLAVVAVVVHIIWPRDGGHGLQYMLLVISRIWFVPS